MSSDTGTSVSETLLEWHDKNGRHDLPWRQAARSPFQVLIAEILLQKTTATAVSGAYVPFIALYPTPESVVAAPSSELEDRIAPLGLPKRAGYLERCAAQLLDRHSGRVPRNRSELLDLHGVGEYTARSVQIHSYGRDTTAVDTNVKRFVSRFFGREPDRRNVRVRAEALVPTGQSSDFHHAVLNFAAEVCTPDDPECDECPLSDDCHAFELSPE